MNRNIVDIYPQPIPIIETAADLTKATGVLARRRAAFVLAASMRTETGLDVRLGQHRQIAQVAGGLNLVSRNWTTYTQGRELMVLERNSCVRSEVYNSAIESSTDFVVGHHVISGLVRSTFMAATETYMANRATANERLSELLVMGQTDPTLVDPNSVVQGGVSEGQMLVYRPMEGSDGLPLLYCFDAPTAGHVEQLTMFALRSEVR